MSFKQMTFFELIHPLLPKHGDKLCAGNVRFWNEHGNLCYDKPTGQWDVEAVTRDISFNLCLLSICDSLVSRMDKHKPTDETVSSFAA